MKQNPTWFSRAGLRSGPPVLRLVEELDEIRSFGGYQFWERLQLWVEKHTPLRPAVVQIMRRWTMMVYPMMGHPIEISLDEDRNIRFAKVGFNLHQTVLKVELDTKRGRQIFVAEVLELAQLPLKVHGPRSKRRYDAAGDGRAKPNAGEHVLAGATAGPAAGSGPNAGTISST